MQQRIMRTIRQRQFCSDCYGEQVSTDFRESDTEEPTAEEPRLSDRRSVTREEILEYCRVQNLNPCIDETNGQTLYTRNKIRLELIPYLEQEYNPSVKDTMIRLGRAAAEDSAFLEGTGRKRPMKKWCLRARLPEILLSGEKLRRCHKAIRRRVLFRAFCELGQAEDITAAQFENCETIVFHRKPSARCDLSKGLYLARVYENVKAGIYSKDFSREKNAGGRRCRSRGRQCRVYEKNSMTDLLKKKHRTAESGRLLIPFCVRIRKVLYRNFESAPQVLKNTAVNRLKHRLAVFDRELFAEAFGEDFKERLH